MHPSIANSTRRSSPAAAAVLGLLATLPAAGPLTAGDDPHRFNAVKEWRGSLSVHGDGTGSFKTSPGSSYQAHVSAEIPLLLEGSPPGSPIFFQWTTCAQNYTASLESHLITHCDSGSTDFATTASAPFSDVNGPCQRVDLSIFPPEAGGEASLGPLDLGFDGTEHLQSQCPDTDLTYPMPVSLLPGGADEALSQVPLPDTGLHILASWSFSDYFPHPEWGAEGKIDWVIVLDLSGDPVEDELVVENGGDYADWIPEAKRSEDEPANEIAFTARLQQKGGGIPAGRVKSFKFELVETSAMPGVCMNYPVTGGVTVSSPDLQFTPEKNGAPWKPFAGHGQSIETEDGDYTVSPRAVISSFDWGATTTLKVTAILSNGDPLVGHLDGEPDRTSIPVPKRADGSRIADAWKAKVGMGGKPDDDDGETLPPGDGHAGDGLTLFEEYRGFYVGVSNDHVTGDPKTKDLFVRNELASSAGVQLYRTATGLAVHEVLKTQLPPDRVVNANRAGDEPFRVKQHALRVLRFPLPKGILGKVSAGPGLPKDVDEVRVNTNLDLNEGYGFLQDGAFVIGSLATTTVAHEMLHASNVYHHGTGDVRGKEWTAAVENGSPVFKEGAATASIFTEDGRAVLPKNGQDLSVYMGVDGGECSGDDHCIMRYIFSKAYHDRNFTGLPYYYFVLDAEPLGSALCSARKGTGVNDDATHEPQGRYDAATAGCCTHQVCVNDAMGHSPGAGPTSCAGGGEVDPPPAPRRGGGGEAPPVPAIAVAIDDSADAQGVRGWPILITVEVIDPTAIEDPASVAPITIAAAGGGPWRDALRLTVRDGAGAAQSWTLRPAGTLPAELVLDGERGGKAGFWISPEDSAGIAAGTYTVAATLDTTGAAGGWIGTVEAAPAALTISDAADPLPADVEEDGRLRLARYRFLHGDLAAAEPLLDEVLAKDPAQVVALAFKAAIRAAGGDEDGALALYREAIDDALAADPAAGEPPAELIRLHGDLQASIVRRGLPAATARFIRGDANGDGRIDLSDPVATLGRLFLGGEELPCAEAADSNDDGRLDLSDPIRSLGFLFLGDVAPPAPFPACGEDPTADSLGCAAFAPCRG